MRSQYLLAGLCLVAMPVVTFAQAPSPAANETSAPFLLAGKEYHIGFPPNANPFVYSASGITETYEKLPDGSRANRRPAQWSMEVILDIFRIVRSAGSSWVLVEHPASPKSYASWKGKYRAAFQLKQPENLDADRIARLKESAAREIKLTRTWINIDHAITIKPVTAESLGVGED